MKICSYCKRFSGRAQCGVCRRPTVLFIPVKILKEIIKHMKMDLNDPRVMLKEFHKRLCRRMKWRAIKHIWTIKDGSYILGVRDRDGAAELLACLKGQPSEIVHTGVLNDLDDQANVQDILAAAEGQWQDPESWRVYEIKFIIDDTWVYWLKDSAAKPACRPYKATVRQGKELTEAAYNTKKKAGARFRNLIKNWEA